MLTIDFETKAIDGNVITNPPRPVGVAIKLDNEPGYYLSWGHPSGNTTVFESAKAHLLPLLDAACKKNGWLAHNAPFELSVLRKWFGWTCPDSFMVHDTQFLIFLCDPYAASMSLKPSADRILGMAPAEQDAVKNWVIENVLGLQIQQII